MQVQIITGVNSKWLLGKDAFKFKFLSMDLPSHTHADRLLCKGPTMRAGIQHFPVASFWLKHIILKQKGAQYLKAAVFHFARQTIKNITVYDLLYFPIKWRAGSRKDEKGSMFQSVTNLITGDVTEYCATCAACPFRSGQVRSRGYYNIIY